MSLDYIRKTYGVPAKRGEFVEYTDAQGKKRSGVITGSNHSYLRIKLDGDKHAGNYHPTWNLIFLGK